MLNIDEQSFENSLYKTLNKFEAWKYKENRKRLKDMQQLRKSTGDPWNASLIDDNLTEFLRWLAERKVTKK